MKKAIKTMLGVTLLEIMLVLAIAAMVIVLSIKYYQSANSSSQANAIMGTLQSITAAAANISQGQGTYSNISNTTLQGVLPTSTFTAPWGGAVTFTGSAGAFTVSVAGAPTGVCTLVNPKLSADTHTSNGSSCSGGALTYKYTDNP